MAMVIRSITSVNQFWPILSGFFILGSMCEIIAKVVKNVSETMCSVIARYDHL